MILTRLWIERLGIEVKKMVGTVCVAMLFGILIYLYHDMGTPQYSLYKLGNAIHDKDYETARFYVDEDRLSQDISSSVVDVIMKQTQARMDHEEAGNPFGGLGQGLVQLMEPQLKATEQQQVKDVIDSFLGKDASLDARTKVTPFDSAKLEGVRIARINIVGNTAEVIIDHLPSGLPFKLTEFHIRMARIPDSRKWRIVGMPDIAPAFAQALGTPGAS